MPDETAQEQAGAVVPSFSLAGRTAVITGGSRGIGRAIAGAFAAAGASVAICARGPESLDLAVADLRAAGATAIGVPGDATDFDDAVRTVNAAVEAFGTVDILVNNAGGAPFLSTIDSVRPEGFEKYFRVNFFSAVTFLRAVAPVFLPRRSGCVLNMASVAGLIGSPGLTYYASAKAGIISLTRTVSREWAAAGVRVNALAPGWIETGMNRGARQDPEFLRTTLATIPLGRWGRPEDVTGAAVFLCSPAASWITGATLVIDGGQTTSSLSGI
jgi:NAD(P)-dependent dehydrogenase (short-subunit alcohol dehydrogenase family)